jgi:GT2 family glycosyltransferase
MDDERAAAKRQSAGRSRQGTPAEVILDTVDGFDEETYFKFNPDVRQAVAGGAFRSGRDHFDQFGRAEGRPYKRVDPRARNRVIVTATTRAAAASKPAPCAVESVRLSSSGGIFVIGWADDTADPIASVELYFLGWSAAFDGASLARSRRMDVDSALGNVSRRHYGFWGFLFAGAALGGGPCSAVIRLRSGAETGFTITAQATTDHELRKLTLGYLATSNYYGNHEFAAIGGIENGIGGQLVALNAAVTRAMAAAPYVQRFGTGRARYRGSFVVCLYGKPEYMFLQCALFARQAGIQDYEFIYVCNSPHLGETLLREAERCTLIYGIDLTVVILAGNAGVGPANNLGARFSRSDRLLITNPDVLPRDQDWIARHSALISERSAAQTDLFSAPLFYDNGALAEAGMYFETDPIPGGGAASLLRVERYGSGAPPDTAEFLRPRPVPAVTGAFMSINRAWFERLGGFSEDYIFGRYEDADFCLKSLGQGRAPWLHDVQLWHLEGAGSTGLRQHGGGALVNRWLFTETWAEVVTPALLGPAPAHPAFAPPAAPAATLGVRKPPKRSGKA